MKKCVHIVTTLELGGAQQNTLFTVRNLARFEGILITGREGIINSPQTQSRRIPFLIRKVNPFFDFLAFAEIFFLLRKIRPVIVHTHSSKAGILGRWAAYFSKVPVIIHTFHGFGFNDWQRPAARKFFIFLEKITAKISTHLFAVSIKNIEKAVRLGICERDKISLVHSGIDVRKWENHIGRKQAKGNFGIGENTPVCGMVACFKKQKNPLAFVEVARRLKRIFSEMKFILVGDGVLRPAVEKKIRQYRLGDSFILTGWRTDIEKIIPAFDVNVLTSLWEGLPRVILEAGVCLIPQVVSDVDGNSEIITDGVTGFLVKPWNIAGFVEKIKYLIENPGAARIFAHKLRKKITGDFEINNMVYLIEQKYATLLKSSRLANSLPAAGRMENVESENQNDTGQKGQK
ncbi:MAG: glycosyltransferase family 4 protein [Elusimicrobia bacterium]|nr:glycosyltransferase family 4 protein [Elusimicrobiota bacterium]